MNANLATALAAAEVLSAAERRELIELLAAGLDDPPQGMTGQPAPFLTEAWQQEIAQRSAEYDAGQADMVDWQEVQARWQSRRKAGG